MSEYTKIEWATHTFNGWEGCKKVGPGCANCYAEARNARFGGGVAVNWGPGAPRRRTSAANWAKPLQWNKNHDAFFAQHGHRQRVFCSSLADVFDNEVDPQWRVDLFELIKATPNLDWLLLTKRVGNVNALLLEALKLQADKFDDGTLAYWIGRWFDGFPPKNVWLGATIVNQKEGDRDIPKLLAIPAAKRFLSMEPLLGPVSFEGMWVPHPNPSVHINMLEELDWVIVGGESGPNARPMHPDWARGLRDQCQAAGLPFLFKQWGEWVDFEQMSTAWWNGLSYAQRIALEQVRLDGLQMNRVGKKAAGRMLDDCTWDGFPA